MVTNNLKTANAEKRGFCGGRREISPLYFEFNSILILDGIACARFNSDDIHVKEVKQHVVA